MDKEQIHTMRSLVANGAYVETPFAHRKHDVACAHVEVTCTQVMGRDAGIGT